MINIIGGTFTINNGVLFLEDSIIEYDKELLPFESAMAGMDFLNLLNKALPEMDCKKVGHRVCRCLFKPVVFNIENE